MLALGLGIDQVEQAFRFGQIHPAIFHRAAGKLAGSRLAEAGSEKRFGNGFDHGGAAMALDFHHIFACERAGRGKGDQHGFVDKFAFVREASQDSAARGQGATAAQRLGSRDSLRARNTDDSHARPTRRGGQRKNRVAVCRKTLWL